MSMIVVHQITSHFPFPAILSLPRPPSSWIPQSRAPIVCPRFTKTGKRGSNFRDETGPAKETDFFNEKGVVEDMDAYLNYLSLEYESVWDTKPSWCQPWTIWTTGIVIITCSWLVLNSTVVTAAAAALVCLWWYLFLYSYPKAYTDMIAERRKNVTNGLEDTYGTETER